MYEENGTLNCRKVNNIAKTTTTPWEIQQMIICNKNYWVFEQKIICQNKFYNRSWYTVTLALHTKNLQD
jgi:hypothetical protein